MPIPSYDAGGKEADGLALLYITEGSTQSAQLRTGDPVDQVVEWFQKHMKRHGFKTLYAAGIDTCRYRSANTGGCEPVDAYVNRGSTEILKNVVLSSNSA